MGILGAAMAAAGDAGVQSMNQNIELQNRLDLEAQKSALDHNNQLSLLAAQKQASIDAANQQRTDMVSNINAAQTGIIQNAINNKYAASDAAVAAANAGQTDAPLTPEQQAAIDQSKQLDSASLKNDATYIEASKQAGYIGAKDIMQDASKNQIAAVRAENYKDKTEMAEKVAKIAADAKIDAMGLRLEAARDKNTSGQVSASIATAGLASENKNIDSTTRMVATLTRQLTELTGERNKDAREEVQSSIEGYKDDIAQSKSMKQLYLKQLGLPTLADLPAKAAAGVTALAMPSSQAGLVSGKVYQTSRGPATWNGSAFTQ